MIKNDASIDVLGEYFRELGIELLILDFVLSVGFDFVQEVEFDACLLKFVHQIHLSILVLFLLVADCNDSQQQSAQQKSTAQLEQRAVDEPAQRQL